MKVLLFANTDWYLYNFRLSLAKALREAGHEVLLVSPAGPYGDAMAKHGLRWMSAPMDRRSLNPLRELVLLEWLRRLIRREKVDLVHGFTMKCAVYGSLAARAAGNTARVSAITGMGHVFTNSDTRARILRPVVTGLIRLALAGESARLILQNPDDVSLFRTARLVDERRMRLIPSSGVNCDLFKPPVPERDTARDRLKVLLPARMLWEKGVAEFVAAARILRAEGRQIDFLLAGDPDPGNPTSVPDAQLQSWVEEGLVRWLGHIQDMPALLQSVDVVALPSYREGLPKGLIEAGACGLPLVTTDVPGCRHVVTHGVDGLLVPVRDSHAVANAIRELQDSPALRSSLGSRARQRALSEFDEKIVIRRTIDVYQELVRHH